MKIITLKTGEEVKVDNDFVLPKKVKLYLLTIKRPHYIEKYIMAKRYVGKRIQTYLHRLVIGAKKGQIVDHINYDTFDNRKSNLRICGYSQNASHQRRHKKNLINTPYKGVRQPKQSKRFQAQISINGRTNGIGLFDTAEEAAKAYDKMALQLFGDFATLNFPL